MTKILNPPLKRRATPCIMHERERAGGPDRRGSAERGRARSERGRARGQLTVRGLGQQGHSFCLGRAGWAVPKGSLRLFKIQEERSPAIIVGPPMMG